MGKNIPSSLRIYYVVNKGIDVGITAGGQTQLLKKKVAQSINSGVHKAKV